MNIENNFIDKQEYPFNSNYYKTENGNIHYIDEGKGEVLLFIHGTPVWSFLYRNYIKELSKSYRCIALDHLGFGLSDKNKDFEGTPQAHNKNLELFINHLKLDKFTLIVHDFGGLIGLPYAIDNPDKINKLVIFNTWLWETKNNKDVIKVNNILNSKIGKFLYLNMNFSPKYLIKKAFFNKSKLSKSIHKQYINPFPNKDSRYGLLKIGKSIFGSSDWYETYWQQIQKIKDKPKLFLWGEKDEFIKLEFLKKWESTFTNKKVISYNAGHFLQEEFPQETLNEIKSFL